VVDMRSTGSNGMLFFADIPGGLSDEDDIGIGWGLTGTNCLENAEDVVAGGVDGAPRPKHAPEKYSSREMTRSTSISLPPSLHSAPSMTAP
jgi:hypothetical protein